MSDVNNVPAAREVTLLERLEALERWRDATANELDSLDQRIGLERDRVDRVLGQEPKPFGFPEKR